MLPSGTVWPWSSTSCWHVAGLHRRGRLVAQELLDGVGDQRAVRHQLAALVGMAAEDLAGEADQAGRRLVPGPGQQADVAEDLVVGQRARRARLVLELGVEQLGHQVVGGVLGAPGDVVGEHLRLTRRRRTRSRARTPSSRRRPSSRRSRIASWSCSGMPSSMPMTRMGMNLPRSSMKSKPPEPTSGSSTSAQKARTWGSSACIFLGVKTRESRRAVAGRGPAGPRRGSTPGGISMLALMISRTEPRPESVGLPVEHGRVDVVPAAQREELVLLVPVQRRLVAQPLPHRVRVGVDVEVVGVVVDLRVAGDGHVADLPRSRPPARPAT